MSFRTARFALASLFLMGALASCGSRTAYYQFQEAKQDVEDACWSDTAALRAAVEYRSRLQAASDSDAAALLPPKVVQMIDTTLANTEAKIQPGDFGADLKTGRALLKNNARLVAVEASARQVSHDGLYLAWADMYYRSADVPYAVVVRVVWVSYSPIFDRNDEYGPHYFLMALPSDSTLGKHPSPTLRQLCSNVDVRLQ